MTRVWTQYHEEFMRLYEFGMNDRQIARLLNMSRGAVSSYRHRLHLPALGNKGCATPQRECEYCHKRICSYAAQYRRHVRKMHADRFAEFCRTESGPRTCAVTSIPVLQNRKGNFDSRAALMSLHDLFDRRRGVAP